MKEKCDGLDLSQVGDNLRDKRHDEAQEKPEFKRTFICSEYTEACMPNSESPSLKTAEKQTDRRADVQTDEHGSIYSAGDSEQHINIYIEGESPFATRRPTKNFPGGTRVAPTQSQSHSHSQFHFHFHYLPDVTLFAVSACRVAVAVAASALATAATRRKCIPISAVSNDNTHSHTASQGGAGTLRRHQHGHGLRLRLPTPTPAPALVE